MATASDQRAARPLALVVDPIDERATARLKRVAAVSHPADTSVRSLQLAIADAHAVIVRTTPLPAEVLSYARRLRIVAKHGVGIDAIDVAFATEHGIVVSHTPSANAAAVAEFAVAGILLMLRPIHRGADWLRSARLLARESPFTVEEAGLIGHDLAAQTVGVVGWGKIGRRVGRALACLGATVARFDPAFDEIESEELGARSAPSLDELLRNVDIVSLHVPLTGTTRGLIGAPQLARMRQGAALVNTSRGGVVDERALADAIRSGHLRGALVDVFSQEPPPPDHPLLGLDSVICTPHLAGTTAEALHRMADGAVDAVLDILDDRVPADVANPEVLSDAKLP